MNRSVVASNRSYGSQDDQFLEPFASRINGYSEKRKLLYNRDDSQNASHSDDQNMDHVRESKRKISSHTTKDDLSGSTLTVNDVSRLELICLTSINFPYGFIVGTMGMFILPREAKRFYSETESIALGVSLLIVGMTQLINPLVGRISDYRKSENAFEKRRPFIQYGAIVGASASAAMWYFSTNYQSILYYLSLAIGMFAINTVYAVQCGLIPDFLGKQSQGEASGVIAVHTVLGGAVGFTLMAITYTFDYHFIYCLQMILLIVAVVISTLASLRLQRKLDESKKINNENTPPLRSMNCMTSPVMITDDFDTSEHIYEKENRPTLKIEYINGRIIDSTSPGLLTCPRERSQLSTVDGDLSGEDSTLSEDDSPDVVVCMPGGVAESSVQRHQNSFSSIVGHGSLNPFVDDDYDDEYHDARELSRLELLANERVLRTKSSNATGVALTWRDIVNAYTIDVSKGYDFFWVFVGRTFYYIGVSIQSFVILYLRDVIGTSDETTQEFQVAVIALCAQFTAASVAFPMGKLSDSPKIGKKLLINVACSCMSIMYITFLLAPMAGDYSFFLLVASAFIYGAGNGCYLSVDYALALATIPNAEDSTQAFGIWGVAAFLGLSIGPIIWGFLIQFFGSKNGFTSLQPSDKIRYHYGGYLAMVLGALITVWLASLSVFLIKYPNGRPEIIEDDEQDETEDMGVNVTRYYDYGRHRTTEKCP